MPPLPTGDWNIARLHHDRETRQLSITDVQTQSLLAIDNEDIWVSRSIDYFDLTQYDGEFTAGCDPSDRVKIVSSPQINHGQKMMMKIMATPNEWEKHYLTQEIRAYRRLEGFDNAPKFWGFVTEHDRTIGFLIEYIEGARFTKRSDEAACADAVTRMHEETGLIHRHYTTENMLVTQEGKVVIIDFENAVYTEDAQERGWDLEEMSESLHSDYEYDDDGAGCDMDEQSGEKVMDEEN